MGAWSEQSGPFQPGTNWPLEAPPVAAMAQQIRAGRPVTIDLRGSPARSATPPAERAAFRCGGADHRRRRDLGHDRRGCGGW